jgi:hypothetical protein
MQFSDLAGSKLTLTVSGVEDLVGNRLLRPVMWQFEVAKKVQDLPSKAALEGVILNTPYLVEYADASSQPLVSLINGISTDIAILLKIPVSSVSLVVKNSTKGLVSLDISITAPSASIRSSVDLVNELLDIIQSQGPTNSRRRSISFLNMSVPFTNDTLVLSINAQILLS